MGDPQRSSRPQARRLRTIAPAPTPLPWPSQLAAVTELESGFGLELWRILRRVHLGAGTETINRKRLFGLDELRVREGLGRACAFAPRLVEAFGTFASLTRAPSEVSPESVSKACHEVVQWAFEEGHPSLAVLFAEAAAAVSPTSADNANIAGKTCRTASMTGRASTWYHRARAIAVRTNNRQAVIDALLGYGNLRRDLGQHADARPYFERAARRAAYTGRERQAAKAHHDLLTIAAEVGTLAQARRHVTLALDHYPIKDRQLPALAHDWAYLLVRLNHYSAALPLLALARQYAPLPDQQSAIASTLAWTLGALKNPQRFEEAASVVTTLLDRHHFYAAAALVHLARGARALEKWERAESYADEALQIAQQKGEEANARAASELLKQIRARELAPVDSDPPDLEAIARISRRFASRLHNLPAPDHHQPGAGSNTALSVGA